jgi:regulator of sigma E protease
MSITVAILGLALLIVLHEAGHFMVARLCGMRVERFSIGFGKALASFKRGDTIYQIAPIPLGGFVQITGLNPQEEFDHNDPYVYPNRPRWMRLLVLVAGPAANYLTAFLIALVVMIGYGQPTGTTTIDEVLPGTAAEAAGLRPGDALAEINGKSVSESSSVTKVVRGSDGAPVTVKVMRAGNPVTVMVTPRKDPASSVYMIGVKFGVVRERGPVLSAVKESALLPVAVAAGILTNLWDLISGRVKGGLTGPVGIAREMASAARQGATRFLEIVLLISVALAVFNLLPIPGLDGGRAVFLGIAAVRRREVNPILEAKIHMVGIMLLMGLLVVVTFGDLKPLVLKLFG